jgi:pimeloyl-ACP methyl ester carboxylesterase
VVEAEAIADYLYHISAQPAAGEASLNALLQLLFATVRGPGGDIATVTRPKILARRVVVPADLSSLASTPGAPRTTTTTSTSSGSGSGSQASLSSPGVPLLLLFGDSDWMSFPGAKAFVEELRAQGVPACFRAVRGAGHHLYLDNSGHFHALIDAWLQEHFS